MVRTFDSSKRFPISIKYRVIERSHNPLYTSFMPTPKPYCLSRPVTSTFAEKKLGIF